MPHLPNGEELTFGGRRVCLTSYKGYKTLCVDRRRGQGRARPRPTVSLSPFPSSVEGRKARARGRHK
ncbi:MAG: hypothetical protein AB1505_21365, partial [Candidatus Latescibacterota bacterium]